MKTLFKFLFLLLAINTFSQEMPSIKVGEDKLGITSLDIKVEVVGNIATTTYDMLFYNPTNAILEGELAFPLGEGQNVSRLALEVNGKLREAVVVEKEQGRVAFEAVVRRRVDPVLLEKGTGNNYKARIYPIPAKGHKRVVLAHEQELILSEDAHYFHLPLGFKKNLDHYVLEMNIFNQPLKPEVAKGKIENFSFKSVNNNYYAKFEKKNYTPSESLIIKIPQNYDKNKVIVFDDYFYVYKTLNTEKRLRKKSKSITLYWDASLSMQARDLNKELAFLDEYLRHLNNVKVELIKFSNDILLNKIYKINNGNWAILKNELTTTIYDGGTSYANLFLNNSSDEILMFSDGMKNLSDVSINTSQPIFVINSIVKANHSELNSICEYTNGKYINLKNGSIDESINKVKYQSLKFLSFESSNDKVEAYPKAPLTVSEDFSFSGKNFNYNDSVVLHFGYGKDVTQTISFNLNSDISNSLVKRIWAQKKLNELQVESDLNKEDIVKHSMLYNLVSNHTSLIVLETVWDYVRYKITPPEELLEEYNRIIDRNKGKKVVSVHTEIEEDEQVPTRITSSGGNISGIITDSSGLPLPGANIVLLGSNIGTTTDFDGNYRIDAIPGSVLSFSFIGYQTLETTVGSSNTINISMQEDASALDEVVVVGYGTVSRSNVTGSVTEVKTEEISNSGYTSIAQALQGRVAGLNITNNNGRLGSSPNVIIRGSSSIRNNGQPLYVIDGIPVNDNIDDVINVNDIESINVIKDISGSAIYGSRASNGVIVITTKSNNRARSRDYRSINRKSKKNKYKGSLKVKENIINQPYLTELNKSKTLEKAYETYLKQRDIYGHLPAYYIDVCDYFRTWKNNDYELRILTNVAELDFDNYELLRVLGYKLEETNNYGLASYIYAQVLKLRPEDSQSYRDLALVYQEIGLAQESFNLLNSIISEDIYIDNNRRKFDGIQKITKNEINKLIQNNLKINKENLNERKEVNTTFDVRILIDWNHNDTDIDLHIIDPNLEECFYSHSKTKIGGELSQDMTQGFGPEEFTLKYAKEGTYFVKVNYYGDRYQKIENPTFMKVTMFRNFGKPNETKELKIIRLTKSKDKQIVAKLEV
ncbi:TonB-dependent outer membrane receptor, SusC/RagA subfamily, signature region [Flaviramulus basaltis]|uniref:TonB-dependent outer membrane receptor, SusC/RagA subfamily, signature region n=1 Tax=Flaviramulus basaltis TaxID=369401 RepID=A0A1K2IH93_9FLAO|nr:VIT domain-containing protein [Flaviramulus basaltis]SFZ91751.1 TonB-dependent outer membrane receptor, SusC/RagA subfamily, signature region [Flaviramulus basaltis]